ncbi:hypothetical protein [Lysinibacillus piscis]|uniref:Uncharacterized protein n=1 Tax=Lysinibacillus piscis TaxID=2518931 RepID=A0ABQ5NLT1_9BACI|nr:hypothetical protein [Lysinibacillus sp. KH24]GLC89322.1 hypothetical protein LYSBPC_24490 [Lysinibacillus sp. KH24]
MNEYFIIMMDGNYVSTSSVDTSLVAALANKNTTLAVRVGQKSLSKHLIAAVIPKESLTKKENANLVVNINSVLIYLQVADVNVALDFITNEVNKNNYFAFNGTLINRNAYQYAEETQANA